MENILIIGATGYIGKHITRASLARGHPTTLYVRPTQDQAKALFLEEVQTAGAKLIYGTLDDHDTLVAAIKQSDVVISAISGDQILEQLKIVKAIEEAGTIKRFIPSEFGNDPAKAKKTLPALEMALGVKLQVRKAIEDAKIPYTLVSANSFAGYFLASLVQPGNLTSPPRDKVIVWGDGNTKAIVVDEKDVAAFTIRAAIDPNTLNKIVYIRPCENIISQNEMIELWEGEIWEKLDRTTVPEEAILKNIEETPFPGNIMPAIVHAIFVQGDQYGFEVELEATELYPDVKYTTAKVYLSNINTEKN